MAELRPDPCHRGNTIRYGYSLPAQADGRPDATLPIVRFFKATFVPNRESLQLERSEETELLFALMGLGPAHLARALKRDPATTMASQTSVRERLGIGNWHEAPPLLFDSGQLRIIKRRNSFPAREEFTEEERKIVAYLSTGITGDEICTLLDMDKEILKKTVDRIGGLAGVHNVTGLKTLGWLSGMAIGSMQYRIAVPVSEAAPSVPPQQQLLPVHSLA